MNKLLLLIPLILTVILVPAFGHGDNQHEVPPTPAPLPIDDTITAETDKLSYQFNDTILLTGKLNTSQHSSYDSINYYTGVDGVRNTSHFGGFLLLNEDDGTFSVSIPITDKSKWEIDAKYFIYLSYQNNKTIIYFDYTDNGSAVPVIEPGLTVQTNKPSYTTGETVIITGKVLTFIEEDYASLRIIHPNNYIIEAERITLASDGTYKFEFTDPKDYMNSTGIYQIAVMNKSMEFRVITTFDYIHTDS